MVSYTWRLEAKRSNMYTIIIIRNDKDCTEGVLTLDHNSVSQASNSPQTSKEPLEDKDAYFSSILYGDVSVYE
jgi:hypothetical protein